MRAFLAIPCPDELKESMLKIQEDIRGTAKINIVRPENIHLTLKFLGEVGEDKVPALLKSMECLSGSKAFNISLKGIGSFPGKDYIRVVWVGVDKGADSIRELHSELDKSLKETGFRRDKRFHPHLTLARVKFPKDKERLQGIVRENSATEFGEFKADRIELMQSTLSPTGPKYSVIGSVELE